MQMSGNTILITGGGSGIGRALAEAFHALGNQVIIAGRRQQVLEEAITANPGMKSAIFDIGNEDAIRSFAARLAKDYPSLNAVIHNAGIMHMEDLKSGGVDDAEAIVTTNLLGPIRLTAALLPQLLAQPRSALMTVSSGLAFVPMTITPTYCATKAAIHSYTPVAALSAQRNFGSGSGTDPSVCANGVDGRQAGERSECHAFAGVH